MNHPAPGKSVTDMAEMPVYHVCLPCEACPADAQVMRLGWRALPDGLLAPKGALPCGVLHISGTLPPDAEAFAQTAAAECRRLGAKGLFLDVSPDAPSAAAVKALRASGLTVYAPFCDGGVIPTYADPVDPQTEAPFALALTWRAAQTELGGHEAVKRSIGPAELRALIRDHAPQTAFSRELLANYCTLHAGGKTLFLLFDSEETMQMRLTRAQDSGACACFLAGSP